LIISYGDVLFNKYIPQALCQEKEDFVIFVDSDWQNQSSYARLGGFAECSLPNSKKAFNAKIYLKQLGDTVSREHIHGVWMGFLKVSPAGGDQLQAILAIMMDDPAHRNAGIPHLLQELLKRQHAIRVLYTVGHWLDINSLDDVVQAGVF
jgi:phosphoenolpyruvate phosphomutase